MRSLQAQSVRRRNISGLARCALIDFSFGSARWWRYSPLEGLHPGLRGGRATTATTPRRRGACHPSRSTPSHRVNQGFSSPSTTTSSSNFQASRLPSSSPSSVLTGQERPFVGGARLRPLAAGAQQRKEAAQLFPETLPSGRPAQQYTLSQRLFYASHDRALEEVEAQQVMDRRLEREMRLLSKKNPEKDGRFFRKWNDYREIQDPDPLCGEGQLFKESKAAAQLRTAAWQKQFEEENKDVFLPYERTSTLKRLAPNWFVEYFVRLRDRGGADHLYHLVVCALVACSLLLLVGWLFYTAPSRARPLREIR